MPFLSPYKSTEWNSQHLTSPTGNHSMAQLFLIHQQIDT